MVGYVTSTFPAHRKLVGNKQHPQVDDDEKLRLILFHISEQIDKA